jgi:hypothetical protein
MSSSSFREARVFAAIAAELAFYAVSKMVILATTQKYQGYACGSPNRCALLTRISRGVRKIDLHRQQGIADRAVHCR